MVLREFKALKFESFALVFEIVVVEHTYQSGYLLDGMSRVGTDVFLL